MASCSICMMRVKKHLVCWSVRRTKDANDTHWQGAFGVPALRSDHYRSCAPPETLTGDGVAEDPSRPFLSSPGPRSVRRKSPLRVCFRLYYATFLFSEREPEGQAGENVNRPGRVGHPVSRTARSAHAPLPRGRGSAVPGSHYKAPSRANFLLNCVLHSPQRSENDSPFKAALIWTPLPPPPASAEAAPGVEGSP